MQEHSIPQVSLTSIDTATNTQGDVLQALKSHLSSPDRAAPAFACRPGVDPESAGSLHLDKQGPAQGRMLYVQ